MNVCEILTVETSRRWFPSVCRFLPSTWDLSRYRVQLRQIEPKEFVSHLDRATLPTIAFVEVTDRVDSQTFPALMRSTRRRQRLLYACPFPPLPLAGPQRTAATLALRQLGFALVLSTAAEVPLALRQAERFVARQPSMSNDIRADIRSRLPWPRHQSSPA